MTDSGGPDPRVALVTGGSGGLGTAICTALAADGCDVALTYRSNGEAAARVVESVEAKGCKARAWQLDLGDAAKARSVVADVVAVFGGIHTLVYASGPHVPMIHMSRVEPQRFEDQLHVDAAAFFNVVHAAIPHLRDSQGSIVAVTTVANRRFPPRDGMSAAPKAAVEAVVRALAYEEGRFGVRANAVGPGIMGEGMTTRLVDTGELERHHLEATRDSIPLRRLGTAADVAEAVAFFASDRARYITGQTIDVDGGYSL